MSRTLLLDGDIFAYQIASSAEVPIDWGDDLWTLHSDFGPAKVKLEDRFKELQDKLKADKLIVALSDSENFRKAVYPYYKANRLDRRKPLVLKPLREWIESTFNTYRRPGLEGDDVLGILYTRKRKPDEEFIIVSLDKDMKTIPGLLYNDGKPELGIRRVTPKEADYWFLFQTLTGDTTDNYPGCPGIGPKKAADILEGFTTVQEFWPKVVAAYEKAKLTEEDALTMARVARILRAENFDFKKKEVRLWTPAA